MADPPREMVQTGDRFDQLFQRLYPDLFRLTYRLLGDRQEAEDTLQEAFFRLTTQPVLSQPEEAVSAWLRRVCLNLGANRLRDSWRARDRLERAARLDGPSRSANSDGPAAAVLRREEQTQVRGVLDQLPERQRDCLLLRYAGYSYIEIAATLEVAVSSVGVLLARAEHRFRDLYQEANLNP